MNIHHTGMPIMHKLAKTIRIIDFLAMLKPKNAETTANTRIPIKIPAIDSLLNPVGSGIRAHNIQPIQGIINTAKHIIPAMIPHFFDFIVGVPFIIIKYIIYSWNLNVCNKCSKTALVSFS